MRVLPSFYTETCTEDRLSSGEEQRIIVRDRVQGIEIVELEPLDGSFFERRLDETSIAEVISTTNDPGCCDEISQIAIGMELEWYRDGELAWAGIVSLIRWNLGTVSIQCKDFTSAWETRLAPSINMDEDATDIVIALHEAAMAEDPQSSWVLLTKKAGEVVEFESFSEECRTVKELIDELADYIIDYTAYGRRVLVGPAEFFPEIPYTLTDDDFVSPPVIEARGSQYGFATRIVAKGANGSVATAQVSDTLLNNYGLIERAITLDHIKSQDDLEKAAQTNLAIFSNPYYVNTLENSPSLVTGSSIPFKALIPGLRVKMVSEASCKPIQLIMRIVLVRSFVNGSVQVSLEPVGTTAEFTEGVVS